MSNTTVERLIRDRSHTTFSFEDIERAARNFPKKLYSDGIQNRAFTIWHGEDYLAMAHHPVVLTAIKKVLSAEGHPGTGDHSRLEYEVARLHGKESALIFSSRSSANDVALCMLGRAHPGTVFFSDELNHESIAHGIHHSGAERIVFRHAHLPHLETLLASADPERAKVVVMESISSRGDVAPVAEVCALAARYGAMVYLDESRAVGAYGDQGGGVASALGLSDRIDLVVGSFEHGFGAVGSYIAGRAAFVDAVRVFASPMIFTNSISPAVFAGALAGVRHLRASNVERELLTERANYLKHLLRQAAIPTAPSDSHIVSITVGEGGNPRRIAGELFERHAVSVCPEPETLRVTATPRHTLGEVEHLVEALDEVWQRHALPRAADLSPVVF
ncbi:5-aminolevulinate synthase [Sinosporangium siamense]|nr:5-aminolevulinate synthase [Sinosporangium siamense]